MYHYQRCLVRIQLVINNYGYARLRAIENRRSIVRSANTGISAVINAKGEITNKLPYDTRGLLKAKFAPATRLHSTPYGDYIARWSGFIAVLFFLSPSVAD